MDKFNGEILRSIDIALIVLVVGLVILEFWTFSYARKIKSHEETLFEVIKNFSANVCSVLCGDPQTVIYWKNGTYFVNCSCVKDFPVEDFPIACQILKRNFKYLACEQCGENVSQCGVAFAGNSFSVTCIVNNTLKVIVIPLV